jgi:hypothetical protein
VHARAEILEALDCGLKVVSNTSSFRLRGKQEVLYASADFAWVLFGRSQHKMDDPRHAFRQLVARLMPEYFAVLNARYGIEGLIAESHRILDLAFLAANYRYTQLVGSAYYRMGLSTWPPPEDWSAGFGSSAAELASSRVARYQGGTEGREQEREQGAASSTLSPEVASALIQSISAVRRQEITLHPDARTDLTTSLVTGTF